VRIVFEGKANGKFLGSLKDKYMDQIKWTLIQKECRASVNRSSNIKIKTN
jgi:hypothetical protein